MTSWDHQQYAKFLDHRTRAAEELLARVPLTSARRVVDLGCGPGNSTDLLVKRFPGAFVTGVDSSPDMLERARRDYPRLDWVLGDVRTYRAGEPVDVLFANAVLQWVPEHERVFRELFEQLALGGALAVQMPRNFDEPSHVLMREAAPPFRDRLSSVRELNRASSPEFYYDLLAPLSSHVDIWQTTYEHVMPDADGIVEWVKGTGLRPYLEALTDAERPQYLAAYRTAVDAAYPRRADGKRLFSFPRLFLVFVR